MFNLTEEEKTKPIKYTMENLITNANIYEDIVKEIAVLESYDFEIQKTYSNINILKNNLNTDNKKLIIESVNNLNYCYQYKKPSLETIFGYTLDEIATAGKNAVKKAYEFIRSIVMKIIEKIKELYIRIIMFLNDSVSKLVNIRVALSDVVLDTSKKYNESDMKKITSKFSVLVYLTNNYPQSCFKQHLDLLNSINNVLKELTEEKVDIDAILSGKDKDNDMNIVDGNYIKFSEAIKDIILKDNKYLKSTIPTNFKKDRNKFFVTRMDSTISLVGIVYDPNDPASEHELHKINSSVSNNWINEFSKKTEIKIPTNDEIDLSIEESLDVFVKVKNNLSNLIKTKQRHYNKILKELKANKGQLEVNEKRLTIISNVLAIENKKINDFIFTNIKQINNMIWLSETTLKYKKESKPNT